MANIKQQIKRDITNKKRNELNSSFDSSVKTAMKAFEACLEAGNKEEAFRSFFSDIIDKYGEPQKMDNELEAMSKDEANKSLCWRDKERWADLHNKTANLYCVRNNEIVDVPPAGWWR